VAPLRPGLYAASPFGPVPNGEMGKELESGALRERCNGIAVPLYRFAVQWASTFHAFAIVRDAKKEKERPGQSSTP